jgi:hypothetical protein
MRQLKSVFRSRRSLLSAGLLIALPALILGLERSTQAALVGDGRGAQLLIGLDDDNQANAVIQGGAVANQSLNRTDILDGGPGNDVMFGLNGNDVMDGGAGDDIILGGPDGGAAPGGPPNSDIMFGGPGNDVNLSTRSFSARPIARLLPIRPQVSGFRPCCLVFPDFPKASSLRTSAVSGISAQSRTAHHPVTNFWCGSAPSRRATSPPRCE